MLGMPMKVVVTEGSRYMTCATMGCLAIEPARSSPQGRDCLRLPMSIDEAVTCRHEADARSPPGLQMLSSCRSSTSTRSRQSAESSPGAPPGLELETDSLVDTDDGSNAEDPTSAAPAGICSGEGPRDLYHELPTTLHIRNLPCYFTRPILLGMMNAQGLAGLYDFVYLPMDFKTKASIGYAFLNFRSSAAALSFYASMDGFSQWPIRSKKVCSVQWSSTQGLEANVRLILKSGVMKKKCPDEFKPTVFVEGQLVPFPTHRMWPTRP